MAKLDETPLTEADGDRAIRNLREQVETARRHVREYRQRLLEMRGVESIASKDGTPQKRS
jgi:hypothetical protein